MSKGNIVLDILGIGGFSRPPPKCPLNIFARISYQVGEEWLLTKGQGRL